MWLFLNIFIQFWFHWSRILKAIVNAKMIYIWLLWSRLGSSKMLVEHKITYGEGNFFTFQAIFSFCQATQKQNLDCPIKIKSNIQVVFCWWNSLIWKKNIFISHLDTWERAVGKNDAYNTFRRKWNHDKFTHAQRWRNKQKRIV